MRHGIIPSCVVGAAIPPGMHLGAGWVATEIKRWLNLCSLPHMMMCVSPPHVGLARFESMDNPSNQRALSLMSSHTARGYRTIEAFYTPCVVGAMVPNTVILPCCAAAASCDNPAMPYALTQLES